MILKKYTARDAQNKNRLFIELRCDSCDSIYVRQARFKSPIDGCSPKCLSILKGNIVYITCSHCSKPIERRKSDLNKSKSGLYFCNRLCKEAAQKYNKAIQPAHYGTGTGIKGYRARALAYYGSQCIICGFNVVEALEVHHKDKNRDNNSIDNLEVLCCNCHTLKHRGIHMA